MTSTGVSHDQALIWTPLGGETDFGTRQMRFSEFKPADSSTSMKRSGCLISVLVSEAEGAVRAQHQEQAWTAGSTLNYRFILMITEV